MKGLNIYSKKMEKKKAEWFQYSNMRLSKRYGAQRCEVAYKWKAGYFLG